MAEKNRTTKSGKTVGETADSHPVVVSIGLAALAAAAAGAVFLYGSKQGPRRRREIRGWMLKMKGEIMEKMETMSDMNRDVYEKVVGEVAEKYNALKNVDRQELNDFIADMRTKWQHIEKQMKKASGGTKTRKKRTIKPKKKS